MIEKFPFPFLIVLSDYFRGVAGFGDKPSVLSPEIDGEIFIIEGGGITGSALKLLQ